MWVILRKLSFLHRTPLVSRNFTSLLCRKSVLELSFVHDRGVISFFNDYLKLFILCLFRIKNIDLILIYRSWTICKVWQVFRDLKSACYIAPKNGHCIKCFRLFSFMQNLWQGRFIEDILNEDILSWQWDVLRVNLKVCWLVDGMIVSLSQYHFCLVVLDLF